MIIPINVPNLQKLLYRKDNPINMLKSILIFGAPRTGKTLLATQIITGVLKYNGNKIYKCKYISANENIDFFKHTASEFEFCSEKEFDFWITNNLIQFETIKNNDFFPKSHKGIDILIFDSINVALIRDNLIKRNEFREALNFYNKQNYLSIILLEEYKNSNDDYLNELQTECGFMCDVILKLDKMTKGQFQINYFQILKSRYSQTVPGKHVYKIFHPKSELLCLKDHNGIVIYPSVYFYISKINRTENKVNKYTHTGIALLDEIITTNESENTYLNGVTINEKSCISINGNSFNHIINLSFNLLLGETWGNNDCNNVLIICMDDKLNIDLSKCPLANISELFMSKQVNDKFKSLDNGYWIYDISKKN